MASTSLRSPAVLLCVLVVLGGGMGTPFGSAISADPATSDAPDGRVRPLDVRAAWRARRRRRSAGGRPSASPSTAPPGEPGSLVVAAVHADAAGDDIRNLDDEYVVLRNDGTARLDLSGWTVTDAAGKTYEFPAGATLRPGESLTLHTGHGETRPPDYYWGARARSGTTTATR